MIALTLPAPWAVLVAAGLKRAEGRSWPTDYRGWLAIHASGKMPLDLVRLCGEEPLKSDLAGAGYARAAELPLGAVVGLARLVSCVPIGDPKALPQPVVAKGAQGLWEWAAPAQVREVVKWRL